MGVDGICGRAHCKLGFGMEKESTPSVIDRLLHVEIYALPVDFKYPPSLLLYVLSHCTLEFEDVGIAE
jgi:hypothetical protein